MPTRAALSADIDEILTEAAAISEEWERVERPAPLPHRLIARAIILPIALFALLLAAAAIVAMLRLEGALIGYLMILSAVAFGIEIPRPDGQTPAWVRSRLRSFEEQLLPEERADWQSALQEPFSPQIIVGTAFGERIVRLRRLVDAGMLCLVPAGTLAGATAAGVLGMLVIVVPLIGAVGRLQTIAQRSLMRALLPRAAMLIVVRQISVIELRARAAAAQERLQRSEAAVERLTTSPRRRRS